MEGLPQLVLSLVLGVSLAAACGLRVFMPLLVTGLLAHFGLGGVVLREGLGWMGSTPALIAFGLATALEVAAYKVPLLDHLLDTLAVPLATVAGTLVAASAFVELPPLVAWSVALVAGGGVAGALSAGTATTRVASTTTTAGLGNPLFALVETVGSVLLSLLAWLVPLMALVMAISLVLLMRRWLRALRRG